MNQIKSLAEQIRQRQQIPRSNTQNKQLSTEVDGDKSPVFNSALIEQIRDCGKGEIFSQMVHIRLSGKDYRKLITLGAAKISAQKFTLYALRQLLEQDDVKQLLKTLIDDLD